MTKYLEFLAFVLALMLAFMLLAIAVSPSNGYNPDL